MNDAQSTYMSILEKQQQELEGINRDDYKLMIKKAEQGHIYGRTRHPSLEEKDNGKQSSTDGQWSESSGTRPETGAIQRDDSVTARESGAANGIARQTIKTANRKSK